MVNYARTRQELFGEISQRLVSNQQRLAEHNPTIGQPKVFWLEANERYAPTPPAASWTPLGRDFFVRPSPTGDHVWLDTADRRIWYAFTFAKRDFAATILKRELIPQRGIDHVWLAQPFMERVQRESGYENRGFRLSFDNSLVRDRSERPSLSAKFWLGRHVPPRQREFVEAAERTFSKASLRLGRQSTTTPGQSGLLLEIYSEGSMTVTASEDPDEILGLIRSIGERYASELGEMEKRRERSPRPVEFQFGMPVDLELFHQMVETGRGAPRLWLQRYSTDDGLHRYTGVDLHTKELVNLDIAEDYAYLVTSKKGCMNAAPRLMTVSAQNLSGKTEIFYEGDHLFA